MNRQLIAIVLILLLTAVGVIAGATLDDDPPTQAVAPETPTAVVLTPTMQPTMVMSAPPSPTPNEVAPTETSTTEPTPAVPPTETPAPPPTATPAPEPPTPTPTPEPTPVPAFQDYNLPNGTRPHDVAPADDGTVWYTAQGSGELGRLDPRSENTRHIALGSGSAPHGVIVGPDGAAWVTDSGLNAIVRVDPDTEHVERYPLPAGFENANLNTATFDNNGVLWFTGQNGVYGSFNPANGEIAAWEAPEGRGPYGITTTPDGDVYYASLAGSHIARIDVETGEATVIEPPTVDQGARRVWSDSSGRIWVSEWNSGQVSVYNPEDESWQQWRLPGDNPQPYAVYVDDQDIVWLSDFSANALVSFDPETETFENYDLPGSPANVRQILGRPGEVWGAESGVNKLVVLRIG